MSRMQIGHGMALLGGGLVVLGALFLPWMHFAVADITAPGAVVPSAQILAVLAMLGVGTAAVGLSGRRPRVFATANLFVAVFTLGWSAVAYLSRGSWFELTADEVVTMASGFSVAGWGVTLMLAGSLLSLTSAEEFRPRRNEPVVVDVCDGVRAVLEVVNPDAPQGETHRVGRLAFDRTMTAALVATVFAQVLFAGWIFG